MLNIEWSPFECVTFSIDMMRWEAADIAMKWRQFENKETLINNYVPMKMAWINAVMLITGSGFFENLFCIAEEGQVDES